MKSSHDDLEAIKTLVDTLTPFDPQDQQRIVRWACEKLGIPSIVAGPTPTAPAQTLTADSGEETPAIQAVPQPTTQSDIRSFVNSKNPTNDMQFAAAVAYYFAFEAPEARRKKSISPDDLQDACRHLGRERLQNPGQTLRNACYNGLLDKAADRGTFKINTVGENLVAVTLPGDKPSLSKKKRRSKRKPAQNPKRKKATRRPNKKK